MLLVGTWRSQSSLVTPADTYPGNQKLQARERTHTAPCMAGHSRPGEARQPGGRDTLGAPGVGWEASPSQQSTGAALKGAVQAGETARNRGQAEKAGTCACVLARRGS